MKCIILGFKTESGDTTQQEIYGKSVFVTRLGKINIIHLDNPSENKIRKRIEETLREEIDGESFEDNCPLCLEMKNHSYDVVYYKEEI